MKKKVKIVSALLVLLVLSANLMSCDMLMDMIGGKSEGNKTEQNNNSGLSVKTYLPDEFKTKTVKAWFVDDDELGAFVMFTDDTWVETLFYEGEGYPFMKGIYTSSEIQYTHWYNDNEKKWEEDDNRHFPYTIAGNILTIQLIDAVNVFKRVR